LYEFVAKRSATAEESEAVMSPNADGLSVAHVTEIVVRQRIYDRSAPQIIKDMLEHSAKVKNRFEKPTHAMGFNDD
jgi:hypothetical protein